MIEVKGDSPALSIAHTAAHENKLNYFFGRATAAAGDHLNKAGRDFIYIEKT